MSANTPEKSSLMRVTTCSEVVASRAFRPPRWLSASQPRRGPSRLNVITPIMRRQILSTAVCNAVALCGHDVLGGREGRDSSRLIP